MTKIQGQYVYGLAVSHTPTASSAVELVCDSGSFNYVKVEHEQVVEIRPVDYDDVQHMVYECSNTDRCTRSTCQGGGCGANLVAKIESDAPSSVSASAVASVTFEFEECKAQSGCFSIRTCAEAACNVKSPVDGPAPGAVSVEKMQTIAVAVDAQGPAGFGNIGHALDEDEKV